MKKWMTVSAYVLGVIIVAQILILGYWWVNAPPEDGDNTYQRIIVTEVEKGQTQDGVVTAEIRAEPYLYCPDTESFTFAIRAGFYNDSELLSPNESGYSGGQFEIPRGGRTVTIPAGDESISPGQVDSIHVETDTVVLQQYPPCDEIAFPDELPPDDYWWDSTDSVRDSSRY